MPKGAKQPEPHEAEFRVARCSVCGEAFREGVHYVPDGKGGHRHVEGAPNCRPPSGEWKALPGAPRQGAREPVKTGQWIYGIKINLQTRPVDVLSNVGKWDPMVRVFADSDHQLELYSRPWDQIPAYPSPEPFCAPPKPLEIRTPFLWDREESEITAPPWVSSVSLYYQSDWLGSLSIEATPRPLSAEEEL